jgi:SAM-dependent methyltransferase
LCTHVGDLRGVMGELNPPYDAVLMFHVIEHSPEPYELLRDVASILRPGGLLCIRTPNARSWLSTVCGRTWEWLSPPAHIVLFSPAALVSSMENSGFHLLKLKTQRGDASNPFYELSRACGKRLRRPATGLSQGTVPPRQRRLHPYIRLIERVSDVCYAPLQPLENLSLGTRRLLPEILALASKQGGAAGRGEERTDVSSV